jgi:hypothetical protein
MRGRWELSDAQWELIEPLMRASNLFILFRYSLEAITCCDTEFESRPDWGVGQCFPHASYVAS